MSTIEERLNRMRSGAAPMRLQEEKKATVPISAQERQPVQDSIQARLERMRQSGAAKEKKTDKPPVYTKYPLYDTVRNTLMQGKQPVQMHRQAKQSRGEPVPDWNTEALEKKRTDVSTHISGLEQTMKQEYFTTTPKAKKSRGEMLQSLRAERDELEKRVTVQKMENNKTAQVKRQQGYSSLMAQSDFAQYAGQGAAIENPGLEDVERGIAIAGRKPFGASVGNIVTYSRENGTKIALGEGNGSSMTGKSIYRFMTEDEVSTYNYLLAKEGGEKAQEFLDFMEETLNYRFGNRQADAIGGMDNGFARTGVTGLYGLGAGVDQFASGARQLMSKETLPVTAAQFGSAAVREDLADVGPKLPGWLGGHSLAQAGYDVTTTTGNMAPSILLSGLTGGLGAPAAVAQGIGAVSLGASAAGNAYNQARHDGYGEEEARSYAALIGASEGGLTYLLGGVGKLGGKLTGKAAQSTIANIDNALLRIAADLGVHMAGEGTEEYLQDILEPALRNLCFDEHNEVKLVSEDAAYSFLLGALTAGVMESGDVVGRNLDPARVNAMPEAVGQEKTASTGETAQAAYTPLEAEAIRHEGKTFRNIVAGFDSTVSGFFNKWRFGRKGQPEAKLEKLYLGKMSEDTKAKVSAILGYEVTERDFIVTNDGVKHIIDTHGNPEAEIKKGNAPLSDTVIDALPEVVAHPDVVREGHLEESSPYRLGIVFEKTLPDGAAVYIQFDNSGRGTFEGRTLYVKTKESPTSGVNISEETNTSTSKTTEPELSSDTKIPQMESGVKREDMQKGGGVFLPGSGIDDAADVQRNITEQAYGKSRIEQLSGTLGENGGKALDVAYDGGDLASFYGGFSQYYEAGMTGREMGKVKNDYGLTEAQSLAAYAAGQKDASASLSAQMEGRQFATVYGKEGGFIPNDYSYGVSKEDTGYYNLVGKATGTKVMMAAPTGVGGANGWYRGGELHIAADAEDPGMVVAKHETTHRLQELAPEAYRKFRDYAMNAIADRDGDTGTLVERYKDRYAEAGVNLTTEEAMDEIAADFTEKLLLDEATIKRFIRDDRTTAQKFFDAVRSFLKKVKGLLSRGAQDRAARDAYGLSLEQLETAEGLWLEAFKEAGTAAKTAQKNTAQEGGGVKHSLKSADGRLHPYSEWRKETLEKVNGNVLVETDAELIDLISEAFSDPQSKKSLHLGVIPQATIERINSDTAGIPKELRGTLFKENREYSLEIGQEDIRHLADDKTSFTKADAVDFVKALPIIVAEFDSAQFSYYRQGQNNLRAIRFVKELSDGTYISIEVVSRKKNQLETHNIFMASPDYTAKKKSATSMPVRDTARGKTSETLEGYSSKPSIPTGTEKSNPNFSLKGFTGEHGDEHTAARYSLKEQDGRRMPVVANTSYATLAGNGTNAALLEKAKAGDSAAAHKLLVMTIKTDFFAQTTKFFKGAELVPVQYREGGNALPAELAKMTAERSHNQIFAGIHQSERSGMKDHGDTWGRLMNPVRFALDEDADLTGRRFVLVDDVVSSGSTLMALTHALEEAGGQVDGYLALARGRYVAENMAMTADTRLAVEKRMGQDVVEAVLSEKLGYGVKLEDLTEKQGRAILQHPEAFREKHGIEKSAPADDLDIRHSLKGTHELEAEVAKLKERTEWLREQMKVSKVAKTDKKGTERLAGSLLKEYASGYDKGALSTRLLSLYDFVANGKDSAGNELSWGPLREEAGAIARDILEGSVQQDNSLYDDYAELRSYLRATKLTISEADSRDIPDYGDFRKRNFGRLNLGKGKTNIDGAYQEMAELWPEFFDVSKASQPADQLVQIADVLDQMRPIWENPNTGDMAIATEYLADDIIERFYEVPQKKPTYADRQAGKLDVAKAKGRQQVAQVREQKNERIEAIKKQSRERVREAVTRERTRRDEKIQGLKEHYQGKETAGRERRSAAELRRKISRHVSALSQKLLRPSDKQHIPEVLRKPVAAMLEAVNLESAYTVDPETGKRVKNTAGDPTKRTEAFRLLKEAYRKAIQSGDGLVLDPDLLGDGETLGNLDAVIEMKDKRIADMGAEQLETVWNTIRAIEASISTANKTLARSRYETISEMGEAMRGEFITAKPFQERYGPRGMLDKLLNIEMLSPVDYFKELGRAGDAMWGELRASLDTKVRDTKAISDYAAALLGKTDIRSWSGKKAGMQTFATSGGDIQLTPAQVMSLYLLMQRKQAQEHILKGGIRQAPVLRKGKVVKSYEPVHIGLGDLQNIVGTLTEEQQRIADGLGKFMSTTLSEWGNEVSMAMYGYKKFTEEHYFPIKSDANYTKTEFAAGQDQRVKNMGFTKSTVPHANNAVMVDDIFDVFSAHADDMSTYHAFAPALEDVERVYNFRYRGDDGDVTGSVSQTVEKVLGKNGQSYFRTLMRNLNEGIRKDDTSTLSRALVSNYKAAAVGANLRVIIQQPTAILRAAALIDPKYLVAGIAKRGNFELVKKWAPIAQWKDWGYFQLDTGRQMKDIMLGTDGWLERRKENAMWLAGKADNIAWSRLWNACELETVDRHPSLERGSDDFYRAVAERFGEIVDRTQVVDSILHRTQAMRSGDLLVNMATSFMAEPSKTYNLFRTAAREALTNRTKESRAKLARVTVALLVAGTANAAAAALIDALRDDDDDEEYLEKFLQAFTGLEGDEETLGDYIGGILGGNLGDNLNPLGMVPYGKDILSIWQGYDIDRMDMSAIKDLKDAADRFIKAVNGEGKLTPRYAMVDLAGRAAKLLGLPVANVKRDTEGIVNGGFMLMEKLGADIGGARFSWAQLKTPLNDKNKNYWIDMGYRFEREGDEETAGTIYDALTGAGIPAEKIEERKRAVLKKSDGFIGRKEEVRGGITADLERNRGFLRLPGEQRDKAMDAAETYANIATMLELDPDYEVPDTFQWVRKADAGASVGIEPYEYILFDLAYSMCESEKKDGKTVPNSKQDKVIDVLDKMAWLTDEERDYLFGAKYTSDKNNPYN